VDHPESPLYSFRADNCSVSFSQIGLDGQLLGNTAPTTFPLTFQELALVKLQFAPLKIEGSLDRLLLIARNAEGRVLSELLVIE
jgi:hypothetical protein